MHITKDTHFFVNYYEGNIMPLITIVIIKKQLTNHNSTA